MKEIRALLVVLGLAYAPLSGCGPALSPEQLAEQSLNSEARVRLKQGARNPDSVEFREVHVGSGEISGMKVVCGELNGENGFGGLTGFERFLMIDGKVPMLERVPGGRAFFEEKWFEAGC